MRRSRAHRLFSSAKVVALFTRSEVRRGEFGFATVGCSVFKMVDTSFWKPPLHFRGFVTRSRECVQRADRQHGMPTQTEDIVKVTETGAKGRGLSVSAKPGRLHIHPITGAQRRASGVFP